jgi:hypothetical protein
MRLACAMLPCQPSTKNGRWARSFYKRPARTLSPPPTFLKPASQPQSGRLCTSHCPPQICDSCKVFGHKWYSRRSDPLAHLGPHRRDEGSPHDLGFPGKTCRPPAPPIGQGVSSAWIRHLIDKRIRWPARTPGSYNRRHTVGSRTHFHSTRLTSPATSVMTSAALQTLTIISHTSIASPLRESAKVALVRIVLFLNHRARISCTEG